MPVAPPRRLDAETRRDQILQTASALFIERGFEGVGMNDVAQALGTSRPTIYSYFTSTEAMLRALFEARLPALWQRLSPHLGAARQRQADSYARIFGELLEERELLLLLHSGGGPTFREQRAAVLARLGSLLEPFGPEGAPRPGDALEILTLLLEGAAVHALRHPERDPQALGRALGAFVAGGLGALGPE